MSARVFSIWFLLLMIVTGSGVSYLFSTGFSKAQARRFDYTTSDRTQSGEYITMSAVAYKKLPKEKIGTHVYEIFYQSNQFDIYHTTFNADESVTLFGFRDNNETIAMMRYQQSRTPGRRNTQHGPPFYSFHFFQQAHLSFADATSFLMRQAVPAVITSSNHHPAVSPPPENKVV